MPVTGGTPSDEASVVALVAGDALVCSASVIAPRALLTAAHCVTEPWPDVALAAAIDGGARVGVVAAFVHPRFDAGTLDGDLAVLIVDAPLTAPPLAWARELDGVAVGDAFRVVGYGWTVAGDAAPAERRAGTSELDAITADALRSIAAPAQTCEGDSGGPALIDDVIVGVASSGDTACVDHARHVRVDANAAWIDGVLAATADASAAAGARCYHDAQCADGAGTCEPALDEPRWSFCAPACADDADCPGELACLDARCRYEAPSPGALGATCAGDADCADGLCVAPAAGGDAVCSTRCFEDLPGFCPDDAPCAPAADGMAACFAPPVEAGGCQVGDMPGGALAAVVALAVARLRVRSRR